MVLLMAPVQYLSGDAGQQKTADGDDKKGAAQGDKKKTAEGEKKVLPGVKKNGRR